MKKSILYSVALVIMMVMAACGRSNDPTEISQDVINNLKEQTPSKSMRYVHPDDRDAAALISEIQKMVDTGHGDFYNLDFTYKETIENPASNACLVAYSYHVPAGYGTTELYIFLQKIDGKWYFRKQDASGYVSNIKECINNGVELPLFCTDREARKLLN